MRAGTNIRHPRGATALLSVLVTSALLLMLVILASTRTALLAIELQGAEYYQKSLANAWSCADMARSRLLLDPNRFVNVPVSVLLPSKESCAILLGTVSGNNAHIQTTGHSGDSFTSLDVTAMRFSSTSPFVIQTWKEY